MHYPSLRIHCPCAEPVSDDEGDIEDEVPDEQHSGSRQLTLPPTLTNDFALHALNALYFCDVCKALRCERCVVDEVVQTYCPSCLHIYSDSRKSESVLYAILILKFFMFVESLMLI